MKLVIHPPVEAERLQKIRAAAGDKEIGRYVAEMLEIIGTDGVIVVEDHAGMKSDREYVEGLQWDSGYVSGYFRYCDNGVDRIDFIGTETHPITHSYPVSWM